MMVAMAWPGVRAWNPVAWEFAGRTFVTRRGKLGALALSTFGHGLVGVLVIWAFFGFRYSAANPLLPAATDFIRPWAITLANVGGAHAEVIRKLAARHVLPEAYLYGYSFVHRDVRLKKCAAPFLDEGAYSVSGLGPTFFPLVLPVQDHASRCCWPASWPRVSLRGVDCGSAARWRPELYAGLPLVALLTIYGYSQLTSHLNIGHRHIMPIYPVLFISLGALGSRQAVRRWPFATLLLALFLWHAVSAIRIAPHFIAYFNEFAGGPDNGRHHLVDSSLDWGQDLPGLKDWLDLHARAGEPVYLSYFGTGEPAYYGLKVRRLSFVNSFNLPVAYEKIEPGLYCISATILAQVYGPAQEIWTLQDEATYQRFRARVEHPVQGSPSRAEIESADALRLARLCQYLNVRKPGASIGSILVYRVTPLLALFAIYWLVSLATPPEHRPPAYPADLPGALYLPPVCWEQVARRRAGSSRRWPSFRLLGWQVRESWWIRPHYLAYFSPLAGGPESGHRHLVDSSLDWGQDLPGLKTWLDRNAPHEAVYLSYFGTSDPEFYGIHAKRLPFLNGFKIPQPWVPLLPGTYCIGATMLEHVYSPIRGPWTPELEKEYQ